MNMTSQMLINMIVAILFIIGIMMMVIGFRPQQNKATTLKDIAKYNRRFKQLSSNPLTRKGFTRIANDISSLQLYNFLEVRQKAVKTYTRSKLVSIGVLALSIFSLRDIVSVTVAFVLVYVINDTLIHKEIDKTEMDMTLALSAALSSLSDTYTQTDSIMDAVNNCKRSPILERTFTSIHSILIGDNAEEELNKFYLRTPFLRLRTLATVCHRLDVSGEEEIEGEMSAFKTAVQYIKTEVDMDVRKLVKQKKAYGKLEILPLVPLAAIGPIQTFFLYYVPGTSVLYNGVYGFVAKLVIIALCLFGYIFITNAQREYYSLADDRVELITKLEESALGQSLVKWLIPKDAKKRYQINESLKGSLSQKTIGYIYMSKLICVLVAFVATFVGSILIIALSRNFVYDNLKPMSLTVSMTYTLEQETKLREFEHGILDSGIYPTEEFLYENLKVILPRATVLELNEQYVRIQNKFNSYHSLVYHWYYIIIVYILTLLCWFIPDQILSERHKRIRSEAEEDVLQMQTIMCILSRTTLDAKESLYWLGQNSKIHKHHLMFAYYEYASDADMAINRLKKNSVIPAFYQMCDKLILAISKISIKEAFIDLPAERSHLLALREIDILDKLESKRVKASFWSKLSTMATMIIYVVLPILILGLSEYFRQMSSV